MHIFFSIYPLNISSARIQNWQDISSVQSGSLRRPPSFPCFVLKLNLWLLWMELWCEWELPRLAASPSRLRIQRCFPFHSVDQALPSGGWWREKQTDFLSLFYSFSTRKEKQITYFFFFKSLKQNDLLFKHQNCCFTRSFIFFHHNDIPSIKRKQMSTSSFFLKLFFVTLTFNFKMQNNTS